MKKTFTLFFFTCLFFVVQAAEIRMVTTTAGHLAIDASADLTTVTDLTVTGTIDARDFKTMRDAMTQLATLDLSGATIVAGSNITGTNGTKDYPANAIPEYAFFITPDVGKTSLVSITMPSSVTSIGDYAFSGCVGFTSSLTIPSSVTTIGTGAFSGCSGFIGLTIPSSVTTIGDNAFKDCISIIGTLTIPSSITTIGNFAFSGCSSFTGLTIPSSITTIGTDAFEGCSSFRGSLTIPSSVTSIGDNAFSGCSNFTGTLTIPSSVTTIGSYAFYDCGFTGELTIPSSITTIGTGAFFYCSGFTGLTIPSSITTIGMNAFAGCSHFTGTLTIPSSITTIGTCAFQNCGFTGALTIPSSVTTIGKGAFSGCDFTGELTIPSSVTTIGTGAFLNCNNISAINVHATSPSSIKLEVQVLEKVFDIPTSISLHVPAGTKGAYGAANIWKNFMPNIVDDLANAPAVTITTASSITSGGAILNGTVNANNASTTVTFEYGLTSGYSTAVTATPSPVTGSSATAVSCTLTGLTPNTTYHYKVVAVNAAGTTNGDDMSFTTPDIAPNISYATPQTYTVGTPIATLTPTNTGGAVPASPQVSTLAGNGDEDSVDGLGTAASFANPLALATDAVGNIYVSDNNSGQIRKITPTGDVSTFANGFAGPTGIAVDPSGNVYVADAGNYRIRKITPAGVVSTLAGSDTGESGTANGIGTAARFMSPYGLALDATGNLYVVDSEDNLIRKITPAGEVSTFAGSGTPGADNGNGTSASFNHLSGVAIDAAGNLYVADKGNRLIRKITPAGKATTFAGSGTYGADNGNGTSASFVSPVGIAVSPSGNVYVADDVDNRIRKITPAGDVSTLAGSREGGVANGDAATASFAYPSGIAIDAAGNVYVGETGNSLIRKITQSAYTISPALPAGLSFDGATGAISGTPTAGSAAATYTISAANSAGTSTTIFNITVASARIAITTAASSITSGGAILNGTVNANNASTTVTFEYGLTSSYGTTVTATPSPVTASSATAVSCTLTGLTPNTTYHYKVVAVDAAGTTNGGDMSFTTTDIAPNISYATPQTYTVGTPIATLTPTNTGGAIPALTSPQVSTFAGSGTPGSADGLGTEAGFKYPTFLTADAVGNIYVSDNYSQIRKITPDGDVSTFADGFDQPTGIAVDPSGNVYVADAANYRIRKITPAGVVSTLAGSDTRESGTVDGIGTEARFNNPYGLALDATGNLYVADRGNNQIRKITPAGEVSTLAGSGVPGADNGNGTSASFNYLSGIAIDASGNLYVTDMGNNLIRKITPAGEVTTFAGSGTYGADNGNGTSASFGYPVGIAVGAEGNLYVTDAGTNLIRKISRAGYVSTLAGTGSVGANNGDAATASFNEPFGLTVDAAGNVYVADAANNLIRKITRPAYIINPALPAGLSFDGATGAISGTPTSASAATTYTISAANSAGTSTTILNITVAIAPAATTTAASSITSGGAILNGTVNANNASTTVTFEYGLTSGYGTTVTATPSPVTGSSATAVSCTLTGLTPNTTYHYKVVAVNTAGTTTNGGDMSFTTTDIAPNISYATPQTYTVGMPIATLTPTNAGGAIPALTSPQVSTFAGSSTPGSANGLGIAASFTYPVALAPDAAGNIYVSDYGNNLIRKITPAGNVSTFADGFNRPTGIAVDPSGNVYVADAGNYRIRKITPAGVVSTLAGSDTGESGTANGIGTAARFMSPYGLALDATGNLYVVDSEDNLIRKITPAGEVSTFAGSGTPGADNGNGTSASFYYLSGIAIDASGNLYVTELGNNLIRKITPAGEVSTFAGNGTSGNDNCNGTSASFGYPVGIAVDAAGNLYVAEQGNNLIRKITPAGDVSTLAGNGSVGADNGAAATASFKEPYGVALDASGSLYVAESGNHLIRKIKLVTYTISPALPGGLSFDGATGAISGTPTSASAATMYTVSTANSGGSSTATISIAVKNPQTITFGTLPSKTYGDATFDLATTSTSGLAVSYSSDNTAVATVSGTTVTIVGAGIANITASQAGDATYGAATNVIQQLTVGKKAVTVTAATNTKTYDGTTVSIAIPAVGVLAAGDAIDVAPTQAFDNADIGTTHVLTASGLTIKKGSVDVTGNYDISYGTATGTINKMAVTVTAVTDTKTYDGTTGSTVIPAVGALATGDAINVVPTQAFDNATVGTTHVLTASGLTIKKGSMDVTANYDISYATATGTINKLGVTVTATADTKTYDGTTGSTVIPAVGALATGDAINVVPTQAFDNATVGTTHVLTASGLTIKNGSTDVTGNYDISYATATGTVNKKAVTVTAATDTKVYDGTTVSKVAPTVGTLIPGDAINTAPTQAFDNTSVGTTHALTASGLTIKNGSTDVTGNYDISYVSATGTITAKFLKITAPTVTLTKVYDGNAVATVTTGTLSGVVTSDAGKVTVTAVASYDNATAGTNKTITVVYVLGGSAAGNYSAPDDFVVTGAEIFSGSITLELLSNPTSNPRNNDLVLSYNVVAGGPTQYKITFETAALAVGIQNVDYTGLATTGASGSITITVPKGTRPGKYKGTLQMRNDSGVESTAYDFVIIVNIPTEYIAVKYNRVLVLDNSTKMFSAYQWYKDGVAIEGATKQFYRDPKGLVGTYSMMGTTTDGEVLYSFPKVLNIPITQKVTAYPSMVRANQTCTVEIADEAMELDLRGAELSVYSSQGIRVYHSTKVEYLNTIQLPTMSGVYSGRVTIADGQSFLFKVIVAN